MIRNIFKIALLVSIIAVFWILLKYHNLIFSNIDERILEGRATKYYNGSEVLITKLGTKKGEVGYRIGGELRSEYASSRGFVVDSYNNIFVLDNVNGRILKFNQNGNLVQTFTKGVSKNREFNPFPYSGIIKDNSDNIYFIDNGYTVKRLGQDGNVSTIWQTEVTQISFISLDQIENLYVFLKNWEVILIDKKGEKQIYNVPSRGENYYVINSLIDKNGNIYQILLKDKKNYEVRLLDLLGKVLKNIPCTDFDLFKNGARFVATNMLDEYLYLKLQPLEEKYQMIVKMDLECNVVDTLKLPYVYPWGTTYITKDEEVYLSRSLILEDGKWGQWIIEKHKF